MTAWFVVCLRRIRVFVYVLVILVCVLEFLIYSCSLLLEHLGLCWLYIV